MTKIQGVRFSDLPAIPGPIAADDGLIVYRNGLRRTTASAVLRLDDFPVERFGAITLGTNPAPEEAEANCLAVNAAIAAAAAAGGGRVLLPKGDLRVRGSFPGYVPHSTINGYPWPYDGPVHHIHLPASGITIQGHGMVLSRLLSGEPSTMFTAHHDGALQNLVLTGFSCINDMGAQTQHSTMGIYWCGRLRVDAVEWRDWSMAAYGVGASPGCEFTNGRYLWTHGRESIGYNGHSSNFSHPCVGIMWPGDHVVVSGNYFHGREVEGFLSSGSEPETLPLDWIPGPGDLRWWHPSAWHGWSGP